MMLVPREPAFWEGSKSMKIREMWKEMEKGWFLLMKSRFQ